jgi:hypothetical protein
MTTKLIRAFGVALFAAASLLAQGSQTILVDVPFGFHMGPSIFPAGEYTVYTDASTGLVRMRSADSKSSAMIQTHAVQSRSTPEVGKLIFHKYGDEYFLAQVWKPGSDTGRELRVSRREMEVAANTRRGIEPLVARK